MRGQTEFTHPPMNEGELVLIPHQNALNLSKSDAWCSVCAFAKQFSSIADLQNMLREKATPRQGGSVFIPITQLCG